MLFPNLPKFPKQFKGRNKGVSKSGNSAAYCSKYVTSKLSGCFVLKATSVGRITSKEIEAARKAIVRSIKRSGKFIIRIFPDIPVTSKPAEVRMGSGKGAVDRWVFRTKPGRVIFELADVSDEAAVKALSLGAPKLCVKSEIYQVKPSGLLVKTAKY